MIVSEPGSKNKTQPRIQQAHGAGGRSMQKLISDIFVKHLSPIEQSRHQNPLNIEVPLTALDDGAVVNGICFTTDAHTVKPLFFPGGTSVVFLLPVL